MGTTAEDLIGDAISEICKLIEAKVSTCDPIDAGRVFSAHVVGMSVLLGDLVRDNMKHPDSIIPGLVRIIREGPDSIPTIVRDMAKEI